MNNTKENIDLKNALLLFGAGASVDFFSGKLSSKTIKDAVRNRNNWAKTLSESSLKGKCNDILKLINDIASELGDSASFEDMVEVIDEIGSLCERLTRTTQGAFVKLIVENAFEKEFLSIYDNNYLCPEYKDLPYYFRKTIADYIISYQKTIDNTYAELTKSQGDFFRAVNQKFNKTSLFTLNYDDALYDSIKKTGIDFTSGFAEETVFDAEKYYKANNSVSCLHGHIRIIGTSKYFAQIEDSLADVSKDRKSAHPNAFFDDQIVGGRLNYNNFLITGKEKDKALNNIPYSFYYHKFALDLTNSDVIFIIGYSFGDEHINRLLKSVPFINTSSKFVIVDFCKLNEFNKKKYTDMLSCFVKWYSFYNVEDVKTIFDNESENQSLETRGYGWLLGNRIFLYINGYKQFLKEYRELLNML